MRTDVTAVISAFGCTDRSRSSSAPMYPLAPATATSDHDAPRYRFEYWNLDRAPG